MTRPFPRSKAILAIATLFAGAAFINCSQKPTVSQNSDEIGSVGLALKIPGGQHIDSVHYKLSGGGLATPIEADVNVAGEATTFSFQISGVPAGTGYKVELSAKTNEAPSLTTCLGSKDNVTVSASKVVLVDISLICRGNARTTGGILVNGKIQDYCPTIDTYAADKSHVNTGDSLNVTSTGHDPDATDVLTFTWSSDAGAGVFTPADGKAKNAAFKCTVAGTHTLTLTLSDGTAGCEDQVAVDILCENQDCGNGVVDTAKGEACDPTAPGAPANCRANCTLARCGDSILDSGETCDDGNTVSNDGCSATCKQETCGDSIVQTGEICDDGALNGTAGDRCAAGCHAITAVCGDSKVDAPEQCDPPGVGTCDATCHTAVVDACNTCDNTNTNANCKPFFTFSQSTPEGKALLACIHRTRCDQIPSTTAGNPDPAICFCGPNYDLTACAGAGDRRTGVGGGGIGPCAAEYYALTGVTHTGAAVTGADNNLTMDNFFDPNLGVGKIDLLVSKCEEFPTRCGPSCATATP
jgi:cysteine-rich repeat protein